MTTRCKRFHKSTLFLLLAVAVAADGLCSAGHASDQAAQSYLRSLASASNGAEITGSVNTRTVLATGRTPSTAVESHARAARAVFGAARAAMERAFLLGEAAPRTNVAMLEAAMKELNDYLASVASAAKPRSADAARKAASLAHDWYQAGSKVIRPPAEGVVELPSLASLHRKADAVGTALDRVIEEAVALAPRAPKRKMQPASRVADSVNPGAAFGQDRNTHY